MHTTIFLNVCEYIENKVPHNVVIKWHLKGWQSFGLTQQKTGHFLVFLSGRKLKLIFLTKI